VIPAGSFSAEAIDYFRKKALSDEKKKNKKLQVFKDKFSNPGDDFYIDALTCAFASENEINLQDVLTKLKSAANQGHLKAAYCLAIFYAMGWGAQDTSIRENMRESIKYLKIAKDGGFDGAKRLFEIYIRTPSYLQDLPEKEYQGGFKEFQEMMQKAELKDHFTLGIVHAFAGWGSVIRDIDKGIHFLKESAAEDMNRATFIHGCLLSFEKDDENQAFQLWHKRKTENIDIINDICCIFRQKTIERKIKKIKDHITQCDNALAQPVPETLSDGDMNAQGGEKSVHDGSTRIEGESMTEPLSPNQAAHQDVPFAGEETEDIGHDLQSVQLAASYSRDSSPLSQSTTNIFNLAVQLPKPTGKGSISPAKTPPLILQSSTPGAIRRTSTPNLQNPNTSSKPSNPPRSTSSNDLKKNIQGRQNS
jgi:hypothetical protein